MSSAGTELRQAPKSASSHWAAEPQLGSQSYGSSFDSLFATAKPEGARYGVPQSQSSFPKQATVGQSGHPLLTVQCGKFTAPVQREARQLHQEWNQQSHRQSFDELRSHKVAILISLAAILTIRSAAALVIL